MSLAYPRRHALSGADSFKDAFEPQEEHDKGYRREERDDDHGAG